MDVVFQPFSHLGSDDLASSSISGMYRLNVNRGVLKENGAFTLC